MAVETPFSFLPDDHVANILHRVIASSFRDLGSIRMTCKRFSVLTGENHFYGQMSLENFPIFYQWQKSGAILSGILEKCRQNKNPDALFRKAVTDYFQGKDRESAFECLEEASRSGHAESCYALAVIMIFRGSESKKNGMQLLKSMAETPVQKQNVKNFRLLLKSIMKSIWVENEMILVQNGLICCTHHQNRVNGWNRDEKDGKLFCFECSCDQELEAVFDALPQNN